MSSLRSIIKRNNEENTVRMASQMFKNIVEGVKEQLVPTFFRSKTNQNPHYRISTPRLRHYRRKGPIRLKLPANMYSQKEVANQQLAVASYHERQRNQHNLRQSRNTERKLNRSVSILARKEFKASKPVFE